MKCYIQFSRKNNKNINNLLFAESAHSMVSIKQYLTDVNVILYIQCEEDLY